MSWLKGYGKCCKRTSRGQTDCRLPGVCAMDEIPSVLACDVGNSAIHFAHVKDDEVTELHTVLIDDTAALGKALADLWARMPSPKDLAAASVNPAGLKALEAAATEATGQATLVVGRDMPLPIETRLPHPQAVGTDRLCAAVAAFNHLGAACVVADFGTAITIDCVDDEGVFLGGSILPGLGMAAGSLEAGTAQLPLVKIEPMNRPFGTDTNDAILSGLLAAARGALRQLVEAYATELGHWPLVIVTGADAELICGNPGRSELVQAIVPDLVIRGVAMAYYKTLRPQQ